MSRGFVKEGDQEELPVVPPRAFLPEGMINYVSPEGMQALLEEKETLISEKNELNSGKKRSYGNDSDKRVTTGYINAKLALLEERIRSAVVVTAEERRGNVCVGAYVVMEMGKECLQRTVKITGTDEADSAKGYISYFSTLAKALAGHHQGETIEIPLPTGSQKARILKISWKSPGTPTTIQPEHIEESLKTTQIAAKITTTNKTTSEMNFVEKISAAINKEEPVDSSHTEKKALVQTEDANEIFPIVNERGLTIGRAPRWQCHDGSKLLHPVVHLHLFNSKRELFLQKRPQWKKIQPGKYDTAVGGHVGFGERIEEALKRETKEELGIENFNPKFLKKYTFESTVEKERIHIYTVTYDGEIHPGEELDGGGFWRLEEIMENMGKKVFTPNFESEFKTYIKQLF